MTTDPVLQALVDLVESLEVSLGLLDSRANDAHANAIEVIREHTAPGGQNAAPQAPESVTTGADRGLETQPAVAAPSGPNGEAPRILDEREVKALCRRVGLPKFMWDTESSLFHLARFAQAASTAATKERE